jgi:hypothetical protein
MNMISISIAEIYMWIKCPLHQVLNAYLITYLARLFYPYNNCDIIFLTVFISVTHPVNFPSGRNLTIAPRENP